MKKQQKEPTVARFTHLFWSLANRLAKPITKPTHFKQTLVVARPPKEVYAFWRDFANLASASEHIASIEATDDRHSRWTINGPFGLTLSWNAELTVDEVKRRIAWKTTAPADIPHTGQVIFHGIDDGKRTEVAISVDYRMPLGALGEIVSNLLGGGAKSLLEDEVARFTKAIEGSVANEDEQEKDFGLLAEARDIETGGAVKHPESVKAVDETVVEEAKPAPAAAAPEAAPMPKKKHKHSPVNEKTSVVMDQRNNLRHHH